MDAGDTTAPPAESASDDLTASPSQATPAPSSWGAPSWTPAPAAPGPAAPPPPRRRGRVPAAAVVGVTVAGLTAGVLAGYAAGAHHSSTAVVTTAPSSTASAAASGATADVSAVTTKVDPAIADITVTLADGSGTAAGTGMVVTSNGEVVTNNHVIAGAGSISVQIAGTGTTYSATVLGYDVTDDVALLKLQGASGLATTSIGDSSNLSLGQSVVAIGNALGKGGTPAASAGSISALDRTITASSSETGTSESLAGMIEVSASIQPGDSGGALADANGNVVGMTTAALVSGRLGGTTSTTAYAIPIATAMSVVHDIETGGGSSTVTVGARAVIGVQVSGSSSVSGGGVDVVGVASGSPASAAGIAAGDVITSVGGTAVTGATELGAAVQTHKPGDQVAVVWLDQAGTQHTAALTLVAGPPL
jgi:S1-C subfamily serine protease